MAIMDFLFGGGQATQAAPPVAAQAPRAAPSNPFSDLNALQKFGLVMMNTADPTTIPRYQMQMGQEEERRKKREREQALIEYAGQVGLPTEYAGAIQADPSLAPQFLGKYFDMQAQQNDPLRQAQLTAAQADIQKAQAESQRQRALADLFKGGGDPLELAARAASIDPLKYGNTYLKSLTGPKATENQRQIEALMNRGMSREEAENVAYGFVRPISNPVTGEITLVDTTQGSARPVQFPQAEPSPVMPPREDLKRLWDIAPSTAGVVSGSLAGYSAIGGQAGLPIAEETIENRQLMEIEKNNLVRALSLNPRFPVGEINRLEKEISIGPSVFDSSKSLRARMKSIDSSLRNRLVNEERASNDPNLPIEQRRNAAAAANDIKNFLGVLGVPAQIKSDSEFDKLPSGSRFIGPDGKTRIKP